MQIEARAVLRATVPVLPFLKLNKIFVGYFDPENIFLNNKKINFGGDLTDNSAKKEALYSAC